MHARRSLPLRPSHASQTRTCIGGAGSSARARLAALECHPLRWRRDIGFVARGRGGGARWAEGCLISDQHAAARARHSSLTVALSRWLGRVLAAPALCSTSTLARGLSRRSMGTYCGVCRRPCALGRRARLRCCWSCFRCCCPKRRRLCCLACVVPRIYQTAPPSGVPSGARQRRGSRAEDVQMVFRPRTGLQHARAQAQHHTAQHRATVHAHIL